MATTVTIPTINPATITRAELTALVDRCLATAEPEAARMRQRAADAVAAARAMLHRSTQGDARSKPDAACLERPARFVRYRLLIRGREET